MFARCGTWRHFAALAAASAAEYASQQRDLLQSVDPATSSSVSLWIDDTAAAKEEEATHVRGAAYKELHRPALTTSAMGLFGGEPGFEKAHRVWVDPDRPHMKHIYNQTALAKNLRYARYGYFKRDMHLLDIDKLVRHARLLPTPGRLLTDFLLQRVPLPDRSCAAFIRYQRDQLEMLEEWKRGSSLGCAEEIFERLLVTNIPPVEVGVATHAEMIRCCAVCRMWDKGWHVYFQRAREVEAESPESFQLNTDAYDAVLQLCVACERPVEGMLILEEVIDRHLRPRDSMLVHTMLLASLAVEKLAAGEPIDELERLLGDDATESPLSNFRRRGLEAWTLFDFYEVRRTTVALEAYMRLGSLVGEPTLVLEALRFADGSLIPVSLDCFYWLLYAVRRVPHFADYVMDVFGQLAPRGLTADYILFTVAFMYCATQQDGELAVALYHQYLVPTEVHPTPEMTLLFVQACAQCDAPRVEMLTCCEALIARLEDVGSVADCISNIYDQYMELAAHLAAVGVAFSAVKKLVGFGKPLTTRHMNTLLLANSNATHPNGSLSMTHEVCDMFRLLQVSPNEDTLICLDLCIESFGSDAEVDAWRETVLSAKRSSPDGTLGYDEDIPILDIPPHRLRQLRVTWNIRPRDTALKRYGQNTRLRPRESVGSMVGSIIPFGRAPGERRV